MAGPGLGLRRSAAAADLALGVLVPIALARVDPLVERLPSLGLFRGPLALLLVAVAAAVGIGRLLDARRADGAGADRTPGWLAAPSRAPGWLLFAVVAVAYAVVGSHYAAGVQASGDEPHYLVMAQSLWRDHDLDLRDEYDGEEWAEFAPGGPLRPHWGGARADGRPFPAHSPGLPLLLAPVYAAFGRLGCVLLLALLASGTALVCRQLALRETGSGEAALVAWLAVAGPPLLFYSFHLYTEVPSALAAGGSLLLLLAGAKPREPAAGGEVSAGGEVWASGEVWAGGEVPAGARTAVVSPAAAVLAALAASTLPWLHVKMIPAAAALGVVAFARLRGRALVAFLLVAGACAAAFSLYYWAIFGAASPLALYGGVPADARVFTWRSLVGLFLDRSYGLLPIAPVFLLALAGMPTLLRRRDAWPHVLVGLGVLAPLLSWRMWWGGQCPPGRFLVPLLPLLAVAVACRLASPGTVRGLGSTRGAPSWRQDGSAEGAADSAEGSAAHRTGLARWWPALVALGLVLCAVAVADPAARLLLNRGNRPTRLWAVLSGEVPIAHYLPTLTHVSDRDARLAVIWLAALGLLLVLDRLARSRPRVDRAFSSLTLAVLALLAIGVVIDLTVGQPAGPPLPSGSEAGDP